MPPLSTDRYGAAPSRFSKIWLYILGRHQWLEATATVYSSEWVGSLNIPNSPVGQHRVVYTYPVGHNRYIGNFSDYGLETERYFRSGHTLSVRYDPGEPSRSYYPHRRTHARLVAICALICIGLAVLMALLHA